MNLKKIAYTKYSDVDELVINKASEMGMPLIGGTALEVLGNYYHRSGFRKRSFNDLDFLGTNAESVEQFQDWVKQNTDPDKVKVDIYLESDEKLQFSLDMEGILVMKPEYLIWSKLSRPDRSQKDIEDIKWLLSIEEMSDEELSDALDTLGVTDEEFHLLQSLV